MNPSTSYGYPLSTLILRINGLLLLSLASIFSFLINNPLIGIGIGCCIPLYSYVFVIRFKKSFLLFRHQILRYMIKYANLDGSETIADIGTGAGYIAVGFSKKLTSGMVYALDKYHQNNQGIFSRIIEDAKINFFGNTLTNAKKNVSLEKQEKKIIFMQTDLTETFPFNASYFDLIVSSQFLYCIQNNKLHHTLDEIDRVLKPSGKIVFFESKAFLQWNIQRIQDFFEKKQYDISIHKIPHTENKCILVGKKPDYSK